MMDKNNILILFAALLFVACERDANIEINAGDPKPVVEAWIEPGAPPIVILTRSQPYFGTTNFSSLENMFIHNASVVVTSGSYVATLSEICSDNVPDSLLPLIAQFIGVDSATLASVNYCVYTTFDPLIFGAVGNSYALNVVTPDNENLSALTKITQPIALDSLWFKPIPDNDSLGYIWARMTDPDTIGNCYRWLAKRLGKESGYIAPMGSAFEDKFINNTSFDFGFNRGDNDFSTTPEIPGERGYFKRGDTVVVKFCTMDFDHYYFWRTFETQVINNGNPFASPAPVKTNITGGLGIWGGYSPSYDTLIIQ